MYIPSSRSGVRIMRGERNSKAGKPCFTGIDIAEPKPIFYKDTQISLFSPSPLCIITTLE